MRVTIIDLYFYTVLLFPITTLFQKQLPEINRVLFGVLFLLQLVLLVKRLRKKTLLVFGILFVNYLYSIAVTRGSLYNLNDLFYYPFSIIFLLYMSRSMDLIDRFLVKNRRMILLTLNLWSFLVLVSFFLPSSYTVEWGGARYFGSYCQSVFRFAPTAIFIMSLALCAMVRYKRRRFFYYTLLPMISIYMGGSRTYLLVGVVLFITIWYYFLPNKGHFFMSLIPIGCILIAAVFFSAMGDKIKATSYSKDSVLNFWDTISSGRIGFWTVEIQAFAARGVIGKVLGNGFNFVYDVNLRGVGLTIWAHNDFLQILLSNGMVGLGLYLFSIREMMKNVRPRNLVPFTGCLMVWFLNAMFNMFFTYFCALLAFPFLIYAVQWQSRVDENNQEKKPVRPNAHQDGRV